MELKHQSTELTPKDYTTGRASGCWYEKLLEHHCLAALLGAATTFSSALEHYKRITRTLIIREKFEKEK